MCRSLGRQGIDVNKIHEAHFSVAIPSIHAVNGFRDLGTAALIDTAGVHPGIGEAILSGHATATLNLLKAGFSPSLLAWIERLIVGHLLFAPCVAEDSVGRFLGAQKFFESKC